MELKKKRIKELKKGRRIKTRILLDIVHRMLEHCILPIRHDASVYIPQYTISYGVLYSKLDYIYRNSTCVFFNAVMGEFLFFRFHKRDYYEKSFVAYRTELKEPSFNFNGYLSQVILGIYRLQSKFKETWFDYDEYFEYCDQYVKNHLDEDTYCSLFILESLIDLPYKTDKLCNLFLLSIDHYRKIGDYDKTISYMKRLADWYKSNHRLTEMQDLYVEIAQQYEEKLKSLNYKENNAYIVADDLFSNALKYWRKAKKGDISERNKKEFIRN